MSDLTPLSTWNRAAAAGWTDPPQPRPTGIACPQCGSELLDLNPLLTLATTPPQKQVGCSACQWSGLRVA